ncbi:hypothetical protein ZEAMMB73_Zm00001d018920 [Zea mays]|uniref:Uncharacterized protein n=1 Tax=Zea mays TaxID=4577 RepID=A0A1D6HTC4_MAIZE|nr:hypothetical protein ZEAMMB73_Zm00001d018920 [Zea mays]
MHIVSSALLLCSCGLQIGFLIFLLIAHLQNLIDLAGSESSSAETTGVRLKEGSYINKSLLTLGMVGGSIGSNGRLQGRIEVSRAFGDCQFKKDSFLHKANIQIESIK